MILVQGIGMSGYVPLDGVVCLSHFKLDLITLSRIRLDYYSRKDKCKFDYFPSVQSDSDCLPNASFYKTNDFDILHKVVSFAVFKRLDDSARFTIIRDVGLLSGYCCAGVVFPRKLFDVFERIRDLKNYRNWTSTPVHPGYIWGGTSFCSAYGSNTHFCTTAWDEYICIDCNNSHILSRIIDILSRVTARIFRPRILVWTLRYKARRQFSLPVSVFRSVPDFEMIFCFIFAAVFLAPVFITAALVFLLLLPFSIAFECLEKLSYRIFKTDLDTLLQIFGLILLLLMAIWVNLSYFVLGW